MQTSVDELLKVWQTCRTNGQPPSAAHLAAQFSAAEPAWTAELARQIELVQRSEQPADSLNTPTPGGLNSCSLATPANSVTWIRSASLAGAAPEVLPRQFGDYELLARLGQGGMGVVYQARQREAGNRLVALKLIRADRLGGHFPAKRAETLARFRAEAAAAARLDHDHIVTIYDVGEFEGQPYYSLRYVAGGSLADRLASGVLPSRTAAQYVDQIAQALAAAHAQGILHRDVKPQNILLETTTDRALLSDFGLAKIASEQQDLTQEDAVLGTPAYMSPEQAVDSGKVGPPTDIHALGAVLYHCLVGRAPFQAASLLETLRLVRETEAVAPRSLNPSLDRDLETICLKCLEKDPRRRYDSAAELSADLQRWLAGLPILARPIGPPMRAIRWCQRNPVVATLLSVSAALLLATTAVSLVAYVRAAANAATQSKLVGEKSKLVDEKTNLATKMSQLAEEKAKLADDMMRLAGEKTELAKQKTELAEQESIARREAERQLRAATANRLTSMARGRMSRQPVSALLLAAAAAELSVAHQEPISPTAEAALRDALATVGGYPLIGHTDSVTCVAISSNSRWLATGGQDRTIRIWNMATSEPTEPIVLGPFSSAVHELAISPNDQWLMAANGSRVLAWKVQGLKATTPVLEFREQRVLHFDHLIVSPDSRWLIGIQNRVTTDTSGMVTPSQIRKGVRIWDLQAQDPVRSGYSLELGAEAEQEQLTLTQLELSPDGRWLAFAMGQKGCRIWDLQAEEPAASSRYLPPMPSELITCLGFSRDSNLLFRGGYPSDLQFWDLKTAGHTAKFTLPHPGYVNRLATSPDGRWLATSCEDNALRIWDLQAADPTVNHRVLRGHEALTAALAYSSDNNLLISGAKDSIRVWDMRAADPAAKPRVFRGHDGGAMAIAVSPNGRYLVSTSYTPEPPRVWSLVATDAVAHPKVLEGQRGVTTTVFTAGGKQLVTNTLDNYPRVWDLTSPKVASTPLLLHGQKAQLLALAASRDGRWVASSGVDRSLRLWDLQAQEGNVRPLVLPGHTQDVKHLAFSDNGQWLASGSKDLTARVWNLTSPNPAENPHILSGHADSGNLFRNGVSELAFTPDSRRLVTSSFTKSVFVWDLRSSRPADKPIELLDGAEHLDRCLAISPDGKWLITSGSSRQCYGWDLKSVNPAQSRQLLFAPPTHHSGNAVPTRTASGIVFSPNGRWLAASVGAREVLVWDLYRPQPFDNPRVLAGHTGTIDCLAISSDNRWLATAGLDATARVWDLDVDDPSTTCRVFTGHAPQVFTVAFSPDSRWLISGSSDRTAKCWLLDAHDLLPLAKAVAGRSLTAAELADAEVPAAAAKQTSEFRPGLPPFLRHVWPGSFVSP